MMLTRIRSTFGAVSVGGVVGGVLGGVLVASSYGASAGTTVRPPAPAQHSVARDHGFVAPVPHRYGANGMRMGLHCETSDRS